MIESLRPIRSYYESLPVKIRLFVGMLIAANTSGLAIWCGFKLLLDSELAYQYCIGSFLIVRVYLFTANKQMSLVDENVAFMSSERILWNVAAMAVISATTGVITLLTLLTA